ncbi:MAG: hypothetical protein IJ673_01520, partial [Treponema sp.]|nr:hypothetical protein [Treponema sp.]
MKKLNRILFSILFASLAIPFASCGDDEEEDDTPKASLPTSVGENIFSGKTFTKGSEGSEGSENTWKFSADTAVNEYKRDEDGEIYSETTTYRYSYDTTKSVLYLAVKSNSGSWTENGESGSWSISSVDEYVAEVKKEAEGVTLTEGDISYLTDEAKSCFAVPKVYKYEISGDTISFTRYFDGSLPTDCDFSSSDESIKLSDRLKISSGDSSEFDNFRARYLTYSDGKFSGNIYGESYSESDDWEHYTLLGKVEGTYSTSGTGTEGAGCTVKLTFTAIPDEVASASGVAKGTEYTLTFSQVECRVYAYR